jgi:hypothetical protein
LNAFRGFDIQSDQRVLRLAGVPKKYLAILFTSDSVNPDSTAPFPWSQDGLTIVFDKETDDDLAKA